MTMFEHAVQSHTDPKKVYVVTWFDDTDTWHCECPDFQMRKRYTGGKCKHIKECIDNKLMSPVKPGTYPQAKPQTERNKLIKRALMHYRRSLEDEAKSMFDKSLHHYTPIFRMELAEIDKVLRELEEK